MRVFTEPRAYETIQNDVLQNFTRYIKKKPEDIDLIAVIGAYHGYEIDTMLALYPNALIFAVEALPKNFDVLRKRFEGVDRVICFNYACTDFKGSALFHELNAPGNGSLLKPSDKSVYKLHEVEEIQVEATTLDSLIGNMDVDLLWMDVQGSELDVLKGYKWREKARSMFLEIAMSGYPHESYEGNCHYEDLEKFLKDTHICHSIGLDNELKNGTGNSFWTRRGL
jgi:FkbM family methyltransferase